MNRRHGARAEARRASVERAIENAQAIARRADRHLEQLLTYFPIGDRQEVWRQARAEAMRQIVGRP